MPYADRGHVRLFYETFGDPADPGLLLINGLGSQCINYRVEWCEKFVAEGFHVVRFDNRDVGRSTWFDDAGVDGPAYTVEDMADDVVAVLDAVGLEQAHVMGVSMGGMIAQAVAIRHPERVATLTSIMSSTGDPDVGQPSPESLTHILTPSPSDREGYLQHQVTSIRTWGSPPPAFDEDWIRAVNGEAYDRAFHPDGQRRQMYAVSTAASRTEALGGVTVPTTVIHGDEDKLVDPSGGRRTAEAVPGARFVLIEGMGHDYPPVWWDPIVGLVVDQARAGDHS
jgi:pimeloyl-ACP methyl ester carboxylesterase